MQMTLSFFSLSTHLTLTQIFLTFKTLFNRSLPGWLPTFLLLAHLRLNSCSLDLKTNLPKYTNLHLTLPTLLEILASSLTNILPYIFLQSLLLSHSSTSLYPALPRHVSCQYHCYSIVHSELDYCNSLYYKLPTSLLSQLFQQIQNSLARTVVKAHKSCHITPILRSLHWLRVTERIEYKLLSLTYKVVTTNQPP